MTEHLSQLELLDRAKQLTGSNDMQALIESAQLLGDYLNSSHHVNSNPSTFREFVPLCCSSHPRRGTIPHEVHEHQMMVESLMDSSDFLLVAAARRIGMTTLQTLYSLWCCHQKSNFSVGIMCNKFASVREHLDRIQFQIDHSSVQFPDSTVESHTKIKFSNASSIAGFTYGNLDERQKFDLLIVDQPAFISYSYDDQVKNYIGEHLKNGSKVILCGTPHKKKGLFYDYWQDPNIRQIKVPYYFHVSEHTESALYDMKASIPHEVFLREYLCEFVD